MTKRPVWQVIVFGIITLGIYDLVWLYKTREEMVAKGQKIPSFWLLFSPLLLLLVVAMAQFIIHFVLRGATPDAPVAAARDISTVSNILSSLLGVIVLVAFLPVTIYWNYKYCKAVEAVTGGRTSFGFAFGMWFLLALFNLSFIWPGIIQDGFNKLATVEAEESQNPLAPPDPQSPPAQASPNPQTQSLPEQPATPLQAPEEPQQPQSPPTPPQSS
jgi:hypothetical protein